MGAKTVHPMVEIPSVIRNEGQENILQIIHWMRNLPYKSLTPKYKSVPDFMWKNGLFFNKIVDFPRSEFKYYVGPPKMCYPNAQRLRRNTSGSEISVTYCEGMAIYDSLGIPMDHAWGVTKEGYIVDPTWKEKGVAYFGVPLGRDFLAKIDEFYEFRSNRVGSKNSSKASVCLCYVDDYIRDWPILRNEDVLKDGLNLYPHTFISDADSISREQFDKLRDSTQDKQCALMKKWKELKQDELAQKGE